MGNLQVRFCEGHGLSHKGINMMNERKGESHMSTRQKFVREMFTSVNGNPSSKRVFGALSLTAGFMVKLILIGKSFSQAAADVNTIQGESTMLMAIGAGLLGFSILEYFGKK